MAEYIKLNTDGNTYKILVLADIQVGFPVSEAQISAIENMLDKTKPDCVVLLGDVIWGLMTHRKRSVISIIDTITKPMEARKIPYFVVSGNHDVDSFVSWKTQINQYNQHEFCLTPKLDERKETSSYAAKISFANNEALKLLFFDSGKTRVTRYGVDYYPSSKSQMEWTSSALGEDSLKAIIFQHIPVPEIYDLLEVTSKSEDAVRGRGKYRGKFFVAKDTVSGNFRESPCPPWSNAGQFEGWVNSNKVSKAFFAHDHVNDFSGSLKGIELVHTSCAGLSCYGDDDLRGARLITVKDNGSVSSEMIYFGLEG